MIIILSFYFFRCLKDMGIGDAACITLHCTCIYIITLLLLIEKKHTRKTTGMVLITKMSDLLDIVPLYLVFCEYALKFNVIRNI